ncbi:cytochrome b/b6 domain-containing protein [Flavisphingomonas formosensis]|uniref:cytochrome b/b6 domain-containing protein n=1 Tax=Flavisphingomonas formosensis TaxID=861534 RepID=UPI0012F857CF|nr:cytochrome b/b6 domain-containing protein [Sphingomonas formosensis]
MASQPIDPPSAGGDLIYRQRRPVRAWHWLNALAVVVLLMSGMMIFSAPPKAVVLT